MPIYMKMTDVRGNSTEAAHPGWLELDSAQFGNARNGTPSAGKGDDSKAPSSALIIKEVLVSSALMPGESEIFKSQMAGKRFEEVTIDFATDDGKVYLRVILKEVFIGSYSVGGMARGEGQVKRLFTLIPGSVVYIPKTGATVGSASPKP